MFFNLFKFSPKESRALKGFNANVAKQITTQARTDIDHQRQIKINDIFPKILLEIKKCAERGDLKHFHEFNNYDNDMAQIISERLKEYGFKVTLTKDSFVRMLRMTIYWE